MTAPSATAAAHPASAPAIDPKDLRAACGAFATGVTVITTRLGVRDHGMTANAFMSISLDPPLIAVSIARTARMLDLIRQAGRFAVSVLPQGTENLAWHFAGRPDETIADPLRDLDGLPVVRGACAVFTTHVAEAVEAGDHVIFLGRVSALEREESRAPLLFHKGRFAELEPGAAAGLDLACLMDGNHW